MKTYKAYYQSPIGLIEMAGSEEAVQAVDFVEKAGEALAEIPLLLRTCLKQIEEYFQGKRKEFSLKLRLEGTDFQSRVWQQLMKIPYGETVSYKDIAEAIRNPKAVRAVGQDPSRGGKISVSIGLASFPQDAASKEELLDKAEGALEESLAKGGNHTSFPV